METPTVKRAGEEFLFEWPGGLVANVRDIYQSRDGPRAEVRFASSVQGHLHQSMINLLSSSSRETVRRALERRDADLDWQAAIEQVCILSVELWRQGDPFVLVDARLRPAAGSYLLRPILPSAFTTLLFGDGGSGKSALAQACALALARGEGFAGMFVERSRKVGYLDWETDEEEFADRLARFGAAQDEVWYRRCWAPLHEIARQVRKEADQLALDVLFYDSLGFACGGDLKEAEIVLRTFSTIRYIGRPGALVHHIPKGTKEPYGSVYVRNSARNAWLLRRAFEEAGGFRAALMHRKSNSTALLDPIGLRFAFSDGRATIETADPKPALAELGEARLTDRILALLQTLERSATIEELAAGLDEPESKIGYSLSRLKARRLVDNARRGLWGLYESS